MEVSTETEITTEIENDNEEGVIEVEDDKEDPLDNLSEDELRAEAKKLRAINSRFDRKELKNNNVEPKKATPFITRDEFYATNRSKAIETLTNFSDNDPLVEVKKELNDNWSEVMAYYVSRNGQDSTESIVEDVFDAYTVWKRRQSPVADDSARILQATTVTNPTGGREVIKKEDEKSTINFNTGTPVESWYKKKE